MLGTDYFTNLSSAKIQHVKKNVSLVLASTLLYSSVFAQSTGAADFSAYEEKVPGTSIVFKMAPIPAGKFEMGSSENEPGFKPGEGPKKQVELGAFWMGIYEVTHDDFLVFFNDESTSRNSTVDAVTRPQPNILILAGEWANRADSLSIVCRNILH